MNSTMLLVKNFVGALIMFAGILWMISSIVATPSAAGTVSTNMGLLGVVVAAIGLTIILYKSEK